MKRTVGLKKLFFLVLSLGVFSRSKAQQTIVQTFVYTGSTQTFIIPPCAGTLTVSLKGAVGATGTNTGYVGGFGGSINVAITPTAGVPLYINVGGNGATPAGGFNGGAPGGSGTLSIGGGGGGATDIRLGGNGLSNRIVVAGGGGGGGGGLTMTSSYGGDGGGTTGTSCSSPLGQGGGGGFGNGGFTGGGCVGATNSNYGGGGGGGGLTSGGGITGSGPGSFGQAGSLGIGGGGGGFVAAFGGSGSGLHGAGGGGGGYYGGAGGMSGYYSTGFLTGGGGGGGSTYANTLICSNIVIAGYGIAGLCTITYTVPSPATITPTQQQICMGSSATITASGASSYTWLPVETFTGSTNSLAVVSPTTTTTYTLISTVSGCTTQATAVVSVISAVPILSVTAAPSNTICTGRTITLTATGANTYTWTNSIINGSSYTPNASAEYTVTGTNACGSSNATASVTLNPAPVITASVNPSTVCSGNSVIFAGGGSVSGYTWTGGVTNNASFVPPFSGNYTVTGSDANGCTATAVATVVVINTPSIAIATTSSNLCFGSSATLSAVGATGYTWMPGTNLNTSSITVAPFAPTTYTLYRSNGICTTTTMINIQVNPVPGINVTGTSGSICAGSAINFNPTGAITYTWYPGAFPVTNFVAYPTSSTNYTVVGSNGFCTAAIVIPITVVAAPALSVTPPAFTICAGDAAVLTAAGAQTYTWLTQNSNVPVLNISPQTTTQYTVSGSNQQGCSSTVIAQVVVNPTVVTIMASNVPYLCRGNTATLIVINPQSNVSYVITTSGVPTPLFVSPPVTTVYSVTGTNTLTGCKSGSTYTLPVYNSTFATNGPSSICANSSATIIASGVAQAYSWSTGGGLPSVVVTPTTTTVYTVTGMTGPCSTTSFYTLNVIPLPVLQVSALESKICANSAATLSATGAASYGWNTGAVTPVISPLLSGSTTFTVIGTTSGCSSTATVTQFVTSCVGLHEFSSPNETALMVYPNPNNGEFVIQTEQACQVMIVNELGQQLKTLDLKENKTLVNGLPPGVYFITSRHENRWICKKVIVAK